MLGIGYITEMSVGSKTDLEDRSGSCEKPNTRVYVRQGDPKWALIISGLISATRRGKIVQIYQQRGVTMRHHIMNSRSYVQKFRDNQHT